MRVRIVRTCTRSSVLPDTSAEQPRFNIAACPHSPPGVLSFTLNIIVVCTENLGPSVVVMKSAQDGA